MEWTAQQEAGFKEFREWRRSGDSQLFRLFGFAGTGKTTMAKALAEDESLPLFAAFTGKAALVLRQKGCPATTIHSLIYRPKDKSKAHLKELEDKLAKLLDTLTDDQIKYGTPELANLRLDIERERDNVARPSFSLNTESALRDASLLIVDECSMVDGQMADDLLSFGVPILVLGDPAQLPPVGGEGAFTNAKPNVMLTDIQRQARDNPIIDLATRVREGNRLSPGDYGESRVLPSGTKVGAEAALEADQIIVGKNATRLAYNQRVRALLGRTSPYPEVGDRLVCLRNNHNLGLLNGSIWNTLRSLEDEHIQLELASDDNVDQTVEVGAHRQPFIGEKVPLWDRQDAEEFDHGYALTCHKAQGSQWDNVMIKDESGVFRDERHRWLYTALTRAAKTVTVLQ